MSLSDEHKEAVRSWVPKLRQTLEKHFEEVHLIRLGLKPNGKHTPLDKMSLTEDDVAVRRRLEALVARDSVAEGSPAGRAGSSRSATCRTR
jgi:hypothetical protein